MGKLLQASFWRLKDLIPGDWTSKLFSFYDSAGRWHESKKSHHASFFRSELGEELIKSALLLAMGGRPQHSRYDIRSLGGAPIAELRGLVCSSPIKKYIRAVEQRRRQSLSFRGTLDGNRSSLLKDTPTSGRSCNHQPWLYQIPKNST